MAFPLRGPDAVVSVRTVGAQDEVPFLTAALRSRALHRPWVQPPLTPEAFATYLARFDGKHSFGFLVCVKDGEGPAGAIHLSNVIYGAFCSGYLGYYAFDGFQGRGVMRQALRQVVRLAFTDLGLHRLEANIQPTNHASIALVQSCGFRCEGFSPRYLKVTGRWRDHERWALVKS
ncbi:MAG: phosphinothricin acetyltransferase [Burkholderiales bacterium PBB4]|nr:MAG: phosphinothricin acetyltransferase [Burkholderiales bacterium PBB4]